MTKNELAQMMAALNRVTPAPERAAAILALVETVNTTVRDGADAHLAMDGAPWSFDTFKTLTLQAEAEAETHP